MKTHYLYFLLILVGCSEKNNISNEELIDNPNSVWYVNESHIAGGVSNFPVMDDPQYNSIDEIELLNYLGDNSKLALLKIENQIFVYPYDYTNYYEVINDSFGNKHLAITYCPLTQSGICFDRELNSNELVTLKASGHLYKDNLIPSDINFNQYWSQMTSTTIRGNNNGDKLNTYNIVETNWLTVKTHYPEAKVFNHENINICQECTGPDTPVNYNNKFGVINEHLLGDTVHLYDYNDFSNNTSIEFLAVNNKNTVVVGNKNKVFFNSFYIPSNITFSTLDASEFPLVLTDNENNKWDIFGFAIEGPRTGEQLNSPKSYVAAPYAWSDLFVNLVFHN